MLKLHIKTSWVEVEDIKSFFGPVLKYDHLELVRLHDEMMMKLYNVA